MELGEKAHYGGVVVEEDLAVEVEPGTAAVF